MNRCAFRSSCVPMGWLKQLNPQYPLLLCGMMLLLFATAMRSPAPPPKDEQEKLTVLTVQSSLTISAGEAAAIQVAVHNGHGMPATDLPVMLYLDDAIVAEIETDGQGKASFYLPAQPQAGEHALLFQVKGKHGFRDSWVRHTLTVTDGMATAATSVVSAPVISDSAVTPGTLIPPAEEPATLQPEQQPIALVPVPMAISRAGKDAPEQSDPEVGTAATVHDEHVVDEHVVDGHAVDEHVADEHVADEHITNEHTTGQTEITDGEHVDHPVADNHAPVVDEVAPAVVSSPDEHAAGDGHTLLEHMLEPLVVAPTAAHDHGSGEPVLHADSLTSHLPELGVAFGAGTVLVIVMILLVRLARRLISAGRITYRAITYLRDQRLPTGETLTNFQRLLLGHIRTARWGLLFALGSMVGTALTDLLAPWPLKIIFDYILLDTPLPTGMRFFAEWTGGDTFLMLSVVAGAIVLIALLQSSFSYLENYMTTRAGYQLVNTLRRELFLQFQRLPLTFHQESKRGELVFNVADDAQTVRDAFTDSALSLITQVLTIVGMFVIMFYVNWRLALIPLLTFPLLFIVYNVLQRQLKGQVRKLRKKEGQIASQLVENLAIMPVIQAFGREAHEAERFATENNQNLESGIRIAQLGAALNRTIAIVSEMGLAAVVFLGAWMALRGTMTPGDVLIFITYVRTMYKPVRQMIKMSTKLNSAWVAGQRIAAVLDLEPEIHDKPGAIIAQKLQGDILFDRVAFHYKPDQPVLYNVNFHIEPGQRVALVGPSGAGKSTITSLLLRLYDPRFGTIRIDGVDLRDYNRAALRGQIGLVLQDAMLFGATIRENICYGKPDATQAEVEAAARQAHIHEFISMLPSGYDTPIGEAGSTLSGGQKQRIAIARALIKDPSILILDEPTSALDAESKALVDETITHLQGNKTILVIAHQLSSIQSFDNIIVMEHGRVVEQGDHELLMGRQGIYAELYRLQNKLPLLAEESAAGKGRNGRVAPMLVGAS